MPTRLRVSRQLTVLQFLPCSLLTVFPLDKDTRWVMDTGASMHISFDVHSFLTLELNPRSTLPTITFGDNNQLKVTGIGSVNFPLPGINDGPSTTMFLDDVLFIPGNRVHASVNKEVVWETLGRP
jgi:hypothetical protein